MGSAGRRRAAHRIAGSVLRVLGYRPRTPLFVIGTGRCGSSLLSAILRSHGSLAVYPDEANELWHPNSYPFRLASVETPSIIENPRAFTEVSLSSWPRMHERVVRDIFSSYSFIHGSDKTLVVKSAMISFMVPRILSLFPDARFIHIFRSGPPVVESLLIKDWAKYSDRFGSQEEFRLACARYWNDCILEVDRRNTELRLAPRGLLLEVSYEDLCAEPAAILAKMAAFLGIDSDGFAFDTRGIRSQNYKAGDYSASPVWSLPLQVMAEGMTLKGFVTRL